MSSSIARRLLGARSGRAVSTPQGFQLLCNPPAFCHHSQRRFEFAVFAFQQGEFGVLLCQRAAQILQLDQECLVGVTVCHGRKVAPESNTRN